MDPTRIRETVTRRASADLEYLEDGPIIPAIAGGRPTQSAILKGVARSERRAAETFSAWTADCEEESLRDLFSAVADQEADHYEQVLEYLDTTPSTQQPGPLHAYLRGLDNQHARVSAGLIGRPLVSLRVHDRVIAYGKTLDPPLPECLQRLRTETAQELELGETELANRVGADNLDQAIAPATYTIQVAADDYRDFQRGE